MFQRLLVIALFVVIAILLVRTVANWFNRGGWIGRGQSEIKGSWEVVEPLGRLGRAAERIMKSTLMLEGEDVLRRVAVLFDVAHRAIQGEFLDPAELQVLAEEASEPIRGELYRDEAVYAAGWLLYAADQVQDVHPDLSAYETKRITLSAFREIFPEDAETALPPETDAGSGFLRDASGCRRPLRPPGQSGSRLRRRRNLWRPAGMSGGSSARWSDAAPFAVALRNGRRPVAG